MTAPRPDLPGAPPAAPRPAQAPTRVGDAAALLNLERQDMPCPVCGTPSFGIRYAPPAHLSPAARARLETERPFIPQRCASCIAAYDAHQAALARAQQRDLAMAMLDVPLEYVDATIENFHANSPELLRARDIGLEFVRGWPHDVPFIAVFAGGTGSGKGHMAWAIAKALVDAHAARCRFAVLSDVIRDLREAWASRDDGPSEAQRLGKYRGVDLLIIDEISRHAFFGQPQQHLYDLVAWREIRHKPTILTTNHLGDELTEVLGPALTSRAIGAGGFVNFGTVDWRVANKGRRRHA